MTAARYLALARDAIEDDPPGRESAAEMLPVALALASLLAAVLAREDRGDDSA
jgi:hypothetical protein